MTIDKIFTLHFFLHSLASNCISINEQGLFCPGSYSAQGHMQILTPLLAVDELRHHSAPCMFNGAYV